MITTILWILFYLVYGGLLMLMHYLAKRKYNYWLLFFWLPLIFGVVIIAIFKPKNY